MFRFLKNYQKNANARPVPVAPKPLGSTFALLAPCSLRPPGHLRCASYATPVASVGLTQISLRKALNHAQTPKRPNRALRHPALIETPLQDSRGSAKEGSTVVSTV
jgi:hypothetical protein